LIMPELSMLAHLLILMGFQLAGEVIVTTLGLVFPGPLCGLLLLLGWLHLRGGPSEGLARVGSGLVDNLGLLFVPAGTAIIGFGALLLSDGLAICAALLLSTCLAIGVSGLLGCERRRAEPERLQDSGTP
jgi:holin-like protein